jgi:hypothetical protein
MAGRPQLREEGIREIRPAARRNGTQRYKEVIMTEQADQGQLKIEFTPEPNDEHRRATRRRARLIEPLPGTLEEREAPLIFGWLAPAK